MGLSSGSIDHAGHGPVAHCRPDSGKAPPRLSAKGFAGGLILGFWVCVSAAGAEPFRVATWAGDFSRKGPGLLLKELTSRDPIPGEATLQDAQADVLLLTEFDYDAGLVALTALQGRLQALGLDYPHVFAARPNTGMATGMDLDGDGLRGGPRDAQGYGWFSGQGGQAVLSRWPVRLVADYTAVLWRDLPEALMTEEDPFADGQRLSSVAHWHLEVAHPAGAVAVLTIAATPPVFDGPEDRNGRRNADEVRLWQEVLEGRFGTPVEGRFVLLGKLNIDPLNGDGRRDAVQALLDNPRIQDPLARLPTAEWSGIGPLRVSYVLPDAGLRVVDAGIALPEEGTGAHRLVWVDVALD